VQPLPPLLQPDSFELHELGGTKKKKRRRRKELQGALSRNFYYYRLRRCRTKMNIISGENNGVAYFRADIIYEEVIY
jgi:hypothetical protein